MNDQSQINLNQVMLMMFIFIAAMLVVSGYAWTTLPDDVQIPVHWGFDGQPDRWGGKWEGLLMMPGVALLTALVFRIIPVIEPRQRHLMQSSLAFSVVCVAIIGLLAALHILIVSNLLGWIEIGINIAVVFLLGAMFVLIGNYLGKVRSNFMFGVRTPWTLTSEISWNKTHRLAGKMMLASGLVSILSAFIVPDYAMIVLLVTVLGTTLVAVVYSYLVWKSDPNKSTE